MENKRILWGLWLVLKAYSTSVLVESVGLRWLRAREPVLTKAGIGALGEPSWPALELVYKRQYRC